MRGIINDSLYSDKALFVLSAKTREECNQMHDLLTTTWQRAQSSGDTPHVRDLATVRLNFPWSEHPTHALFTSLMEVRDIVEWETIVGDALRYLYEKDPSYEPLDNIQRRN